MNKEDIYRLLDSRGIWYEVTQHKAVYNMAELSDVDLPYPEADAKNLFVRDDKRLHYYLLTVPGDKRIDLKAFRRTYQTRPLTFASEDELAAMMGLFPGAVTPFGLLNDRACRVELFIDETFTQPPARIGVHPNDNTATIWLNTQDLISIIKEHGSAVHIVQI